jgi:membrane fusion protein (multidrug efflux system)
VVDATSGIASAAAGIAGARRGVDQARAELERARATNRDAQLELERGELLFQRQAIPRAEQDRRQANAAATAAQVEAARQVLAASQARVGQQEAQMSGTRSRLVEVRENGPRQVAARAAQVSSRRANLELARAQARQAELNLGYAQIRAPVAGIVARKSVSVGDLVAAGQPLFAVVQTDDAWVTANFRETQLGRMHAGQPARVHVDALGRKFSARVESLGGATGSRLSVLPPENATGNYVKVVQRIPVRLRFEPGQSGLDQLRPGMSVEPQVRLTP